VLLLCILFQCGWEWERQDHVVAMAIVYFPCLRSPQYRRYYGRTCAPAPASWGRGRHADCGNGRSSQQLTRLGLPWIELSA